MTVVAAYRDQDAGIVHLAADSGSSGASEIVTPIAKIRQLKVGLDDHAVLGIAGRMALIPLAARHLKADAAPDARSASDCDDWAQAIAEAITDIALEHGCGDDGWMAHNGGLLAYGPWLWEITHHLALPIHSYIAIGTGAACAMGAMWASHEVIEPHEVARAGVAAAIDHMDGIVGPILGMATVALA